MAKTLLMTDADCCLSSSSVAANAVGLDTLAMSLSPNSRYEETGGACEQSVMTWDGSVGPCQGGPHQIVLFLFSQARHVSSRVCPNA